MNKIFLKVTMAALLGMTLGGCSAVDDLIEEYASDDGEEFSHSTLYLKDSIAAGVAGVSYSCDGGYTDDGPLTTSGTTSSTGDVSISYWPGYDLTCIIYPIDAPELYLYDANGPINNAEVVCTDSNGLTGEDGNDGSINNAPTDTCTIRLIELS